MTGRLYGRCTRLDILFDQYQDNSNKSATRAKCLNTICKVLTDITSRDVKLPFNWLKFSEMNENKCNLAQFLSDELVKVVYLDDQRTIVGGGFEDPMEVFSSNGENDVSHLRA